MFRTTILRSALVASRVVARPLAARSTFAISRAAAPTTPASRVAAVSAVRMYSAGGALKKEEVEGRIVTLLSSFDKITPTAHFANDLALDSLDTVEVVMAIEEEFSIEIPDKDADAIHSVNQAVDYILSQPDAN
ncbi:acyl carrier protein-like protein [Nemania sp. NC0429]|nr:acyl carrier protein-like protein [Nemania sp. NC0429]